MKKLLSILLALTLVLALGVTAFADTTGAAATTGTITVENPTIGKEYAAYKVFDLTYKPNSTNVVYTYTATGTDDALLDALKGTDSPFTLTATTTTNVYNVALKDNKTKTDIATFLTAKKSLLGEPVGTITPTQTEQTVKFSGLALGYYYITSTLGTVVTIDSTTPDETVLDKNTHVPTPPGNQLKKVTDENGTEVSYSIGATIPFEVNLNTVNWVTKTNDAGVVTTEQVMTYTLTDTPTGLKIDSTSVKVYVAGDLKTEGTDYTKTYDSETGTLTVVVTWATTSGEVTTSKYADGVLLKITYNAVLTEINDKNEANNHAVMKYNDTKASEGEVTVQTGIISVLKYDSTDSTRAALDGAEFKLYNAETDGEEIKLKAVYKVENGVETDEVDYYRPATTEEASATGFNSATIKAGSATIKGLAAGTYYLEETKAPDGYNKLTSRQKVEIATDKVGESAVAVEAQVANSSGTELPSTGGIGTTIFTVVGIVLMAGAAILLITKKRMEGKETD